MQVQAHAGIEFNGTEFCAMLRSIFKVPYGSHVIEVENRPFQERLLVDGTEVARSHGRFSSNLHAEIPDGSGTASIQARLDTPLWPLGLRCTVNINGAEVHREVRGTKAVLVIFVCAMGAGWLLYILAYHLGSHKP